MKANPLIFFLVLAFGLTGRGQVYTLTAPISGSMTMSAGDLNGPAGSSGSFTFQFNSLTETVYIDPVAQTIRQVGFVSVTATNQTISFQETQQVSAFPNPLTNVVGTVNLQLDLNGGGVSFDTGPIPVTWDVSTGAYYCHANLSPISAVCSFSLFTGGQTYTNSIAYSLYPIWNDANYPFRYIYLDNYPASISLEGLGNYLSGGLCDTSRGGTVSIFNTNALNGFQLNLGIGFTDVWYGETGEAFNWSCGNVVTANLVAINAPIITTEPQGQLVNASASAQFNIVASGALPIYYQWQLNGTNITGATSSTLNISSVKQSDLGTYSVIVSNVLGSVTSSNAVLSMYPFIATPFTGAVTTWGKSASFGIQAWGTGPLNYQWFKDGVVIAGATNATVNYGSVQFTNSGMFSVVVSSPLGSVTNAAAQVIVNPAGVALGFCPALTISGVVGYSYTIQSSPNLTNTNAWMTLTNLTLTQPVQIWVDTTVDASSPFNSKYFYRVLPGQ